MGKSSDLLGQILTHGPSQNTIFLALTEIRKEGRHSEVIQGCLKAMSFYPDDIRLKILLAEAYLETGFIGLAEAELAGVASEIEKLASVYKLQARIYERQGRYEKTSESLKRYLVLNPHDQEAIDLFDKIAPVEAPVEPEAEFPEEEEPAKGEPETETLEAEPEKVTAQKAVEPEPEEPSLEMAEPEQEEEPLAEKALPEEPVEEETEEAAVDEEDGIVDLATPTLAELYFNQGKIQEAIETYEKVLLNDPEDKTSEQRLTELKGSRDQKVEPQPSKEDIARAKTEKSINILEGWLARIQKKH